MKLKHWNIPKRPLTRRQVDALIDKVAKESGWPNFKVVDRPLTQRAAVRRNTRTDEQRHG